MPASERLIVFTRYPVPGTTKTRLIPAIGPERAAALQRQMTEATLSAARSLGEQRELSIEVLFTGGTRSQLVAWLGADLDYRPQATGDLGQRLVAAFAAAFAAGARRVVAIGIDCPELTAELLGQAFERLATVPVVIGPATDGGYYAIGLQRPIPELFVGIAWSSDRVCRQTLAIARRLGLTVAELPPLSDVDRPDDLARLPDFAPE